MKKGRTKKSLLLLSMIVFTVTLYGCAGDKEEPVDKRTVVEKDNSSSDPSSQKPDEETVPADKQEKEPVYGGSVVVGIPQDLDSLDPHLAVAAGTEEVLFNVFEGLVKLDPKGNLVDAVAGSHTISEDSKTYTFILRNGLKFQDGSLVTADDVKYSIERCADTTNGKPLVSAFSLIDSVDIVDDTTIQIKLKEANTEFLASMTTEILKKDSIDAGGTPIGTGPFAIKSWTPQESVILTKNQYYWKPEQPYLDEVTFKITPNADSIVLDLKGGSLDIFSRLTSSQAAELKGDFQIEEGTMNLVQALYLNNVKEPLNDPLVRQALCYAVDPEEVMAMVADGEGTRLGSAVFPGFEKYFAEDLQDAYPYDPEKSKELLTQAGYPNGFSITIAVPSNYQPHIDTAQVIVGALDQIGVRADIKMLEWNAWLEEVYTQRNYDATVVGITASELTARSLLERYATDADNNFINFSNAEYDQILAQAVSSMEDGQQVELYKQLQRILSANAASVFIQDLANLTAVNKELGGYTFYPAYVQDMSLIYHTKEIK